MSITFNCFLDVAKKSLENSGELWTRNAISRSYYCMYHSALPLIDGESNIPSKDKNGNTLSGGIHKRFIDYLCDGDAAFDFSLDAKLTKEVGLKLKATHHKRVISDYRIKKNIQRYEAVNSIADAESLSVKINHILLNKDTKDIA